MVNDRNYKLDMMNTIDTMEYNKYEPKNNQDCSNMAKHYHFGQNLMSNVKLWCLKSNFDVMDAYYKCNFTKGTPISNVAQCEAHHLVADCSKQSLSQGPAYLWKAFLNKLCIGFHTQAQLVIACLKSLRLYVCLMLNYQVLHH